MIGSAVGLGNIWRYPYVLYSNGGGAFFIPYIIAIFLMGIPFLILEYGVGYNFKSSFAKAVRNINSKFEFLGWFMPVCVFLIMVYYAVILGWDGIYVVLSFFKGWGSDPNNFFTYTLLQDSDNYLGLFNFIPVIAIAIMVGWFITWFISHKDLESGLGRFSRILVPILFIIMVVIVGFSVTLPGASVGLAELFNPNWSLLADFGIWIAAFGQIVFSLSLGMSIAFTYASYIGEDADLITNTLTVAFANSLFENFSALGVFSILGYMSMHSGIPIGDLVTEGTGLVFVAYPTVFNVLGQWVYILGPLFFLTIYLAGLTSILSTIEPLSFSIQNKFALSRSRTTTILIAIAALLSLLYATSFAAVLLEYVDTFLNQIALLLGVIVECILFAWIYKAEKMIDFLNSKSKTIKLGKWWIILIKYILPIFISIIWIGGIFDFLASASTEQIIFTIATGIILLAATGLLTKLKPKNPDWDNAEERV